MARIALWRVFRERIVNGRREQGFVWFTQGEDTVFLEFRTEAEAQARAGIYNVMERHGWKYMPFGVVR